MAGLGSDAGYTYWEGTTLQSQKPLCLFQHKGFCDFLNGADEGAETTPSLLVTTILVLVLPLLILLVRSVLRDNR